MSYTIDAATRLHQRQLEAATQAQDLLIKAVGGLTALREKAPRVSENIAAPLGKVTAPLGKVTAPVVGVVGTRDEIASYFGQARSDWADLRTRFQDAVADLNNAQAAAEPTIVPEPTVLAKPKPRAKATTKATKAPR